MTTIVSTIYGGVDIIHPQHEQDIEVDWVMFTDDPDLEPVAPWRVIVEAPQAAHPCLAAKVHRMTPNVDDTDVVWIDGNMEITTRRFARAALAARHDGVATFTHPRRDCIYDEADASIGAESQGGKYDGQPILEQVAAYRAEGHPAHGGLYATGVMAWDFANPKAVELGEAWLAENVRWSYQDQLSLPVVCRRLGVQPGVFPIPQIERRRRGCLTNRWLAIHPHQSSSRTRPGANIGSEHATTS